MDFGPILPRAGLEPDAPPRRYTESEIQEKVATFRMMLLEKDVALGKEGEQPDPNQKPT